MSKLVQFPVSDEQLTAIGRITVAFSFLENTIAFFVWELLGREQRVGQIVTAGLSFSPLVNLFGSLYRHRVSDAEKIAALETLLKKIEQAQAERNAVVHSGWAAGDPGTTHMVRRTAKASKGFQLQFKPMNASDLEKIAASISQVGGEVQAFAFSTFS